MKQELSKYSKALKQDIYKSDERIAVLEKEKAEL